MSIACLSRPFAGAFVVLGSLALGCGSSSGGVNTDGGTDGPSHDAQTVDVAPRGDTGAPHDSGVDTGKPMEAGKAEAGLPDGGPPNTTAITGLAAGTWTWVPFPDAFCRDGSTTGIGVNLGTSKNLMIFLEGGGACFNGLTCSTNPSSFNEADFTMLTSAGGWNGYTVDAGILDRTNDANPVKDWSYVYVPYCTGDVHGGNNVASLNGVDAGNGTDGLEYFVGYTNMGLYLDRIVPTFPSETNVLLAGMSGGGFGAALNYPRVATAFGTTPVTMLDDSGPFMEDTSSSGGAAYLATCLQDSVRKLWGLDKTILPLCGGDCTDPSSYFLDFAKHYVVANPKVNFGLADSTDDNTITSFFGFGYDDCMSLQQESASLFTAGLEDIRTQLKSQTNYGEYIFQSTDHTSIQSAAFYTRMAGTGKKAVLMTDWVKGLLSGKATNPGP